MILHCVLNKKKNRIACLMVALLFVFAIKVTFAQSISNPDKIEKAKQFPNTAVTLTSSWVQQHEILNTNYLKSLDPDRLLHNFRINAGLPSNAKPLEGWEAPFIGIRGHFTGHYLSAASSLVERYSDTLLSRRLNYMVDELFKCQQKLGKGYLSAFPESDFDVLESRFGGVWAPYYTYHKIMQGLLDVYTRTGNKTALEIVVNMASYIEGRMSKLNAATIEKILYTTEANPGNEPGAMNEVLYKLYKITKNPKHLVLAKIFDRDWFLLPLSRNEDILSGLHSNTHLVLVNGFAQGYSLTGDPVYRNAVFNFWDMLINHHAYVNGSSSGPRPNAVTPTSATAEHWTEPDHLTNSMTKETSESCVSHNTQKLTSTLFTWTTDPKYADEYMNTFYNSVMALQSAHTGKCVYHLPLGSPRQKNYLKEDDFRCCNGTTVEAFASLNSGIYYHNDSSLWVNLYVPSKVNWTDKQVSIEQTGNFPVNQSVEFTVSAKRKTAFNLKLLVPSWANKTEIYINNEKLNINVTEGRFVTLNRTWNNMDKIKLVFDYRFYIKTMPDNKKVLAIFYGPMLLAFNADSELILKGDDADILQHLSKIGEESFQLINGGKSYSLRPLFNIENESYGVYATIRNY